MADNALQAIIQTAIQREIDAHAMYTGAIDKVSAEPAKQMLRELADQEHGPSPQARGAFTEARWRKRSPAASQSKSPTSN